MNNKLSELSKPVAQAYYDEHDSSTMLIDWLVDSVPEAPTTLYSQEYVSALLADNEAKDKRIAEVEGSHKKLRETLAAVHNTITGGGAYTSLAGILTAVKRAYLESSDASASTATVEGDE